jgi:DNA-binding IclR family transcriptional regulator
MARWSVRSALAERLVCLITQDHLDGRRSALDELVERSAAPRAEVRGVLSALHAEGWLDVLRMRLTMEGFALGVYLLERDEGSRDSLAA